MGTGSDEPDTPGNGERSDDDGPPQSASGTLAEDEQEDEWRFSLDDLPATDTENGKPNSNVAGTLETHQPLEPGSIDRENAFFVVVGILLILGLVVGALLGL
ncbi:hypothetical protein ACFQJ7_02655 [Halovenus rubra]|uniref:DUF7312 domain-containing protein n=2 Tax=Halovenus rubra TaxID=869890 RepID=A0ABD5X1B6_9EURY|nr:hypothetical protein [Halovenus rubra]